MTKLLIIKHFDTTPREHLSAIRLMIDGREVGYWDGGGCETVTETEGITHIVLNVIRVMASAMGIEVEVEEYYN